MTVTCTVEQVPFLSDGLAVNCPITTAVSAQIALIAHATAVQRAKRL